MFGEIQNTQREVLDYDWCPGEDVNPLVVIGHGVTGNKSRPWAQALSRGLQGLDIPSLRFSFAGNGDSGGRFEDSTVTKEVADLGAVLDAVGDRPVVFVGHSMGGAVGVMRAARDQRIRALVSLAGMVHVHDFAQRKFGDVTPGEGCMWDLPECPLSRAYMDDMAAIGSVVQLGAEIQVPWLLVHGDADTVVPLADSRDIRAAAGGRPDLFEVAGADHVFSGAGESMMVDAVVLWIATALTGV